MYVLASTLILMFCFAWVFRDGIRIEINVNHPAPTEAPDTPLPPPVEFEEEPVSLDPFIKGINEALGVETNE